MIGILSEALHGTIEVVLPRTVIAQVWCGTPRQANVGRLVSAGLRDADIAKVNRDLILVHV